MQFLNNYSNRELNIWAELILDILVSFYFFPKIFPLIIDGQLYSEALVGIIANINYNCYHLLNICFWSY